MNRVRSFLFFAMCFLAPTISAFAQDDVAALYKSKCQACHGADGVGDTFAGQRIGAKDFHALEVAKMSNADFFDAIKNGKGRMHGYADKLTDSEIASLVRYIRSLK